MNEVFVDTGAFYAALNRKDEHHHEAVQLFTRAVEEEWQLVTSNFVVAETHALILTRGNYFWDQSRGRRRRRAR